MNSDDPQVTGIIALSNTNVYAFGNGFENDGHCGPTVILHFNGRTWTRVAQGSFGCGPLVQTAVPDGLGGRWLPMPGISALPHPSRTSPAPPARWLAASGTSWATRTRAWAR